MHQGNQALHGLQKRGPRNIARQCAGAAPGSDGVRGASLLLRDPKEILDPAGDDGDLTMRAGVHDHLLVCRLYPTLQLSALVRCLQIAAWDRDRPDSPPTYHPHIARTQRIGERRSRDTMMGQLSIETIHWRKREA